MSDQGLPDGKSLKQRGAEYAGSLRQQAVGDWMLIAGTMSAAFCLGIRLGGGSIIGFLDRWQTILAGTAAVIAAAATVRKMGEIDDLQSRRHREVMALQMRPEALRFQRAAFPASIYIRRACDEIQSQINDIRLHLAASHLAAPQKDPIDSLDIYVEARLAAISENSKKIKHLIEGKFVLEILDLLSFQELTARDEALSNLNHIIAELAVSFPYTDPQAGDLRLDVGAVQGMLDRASRGTSFARYFSGRLRALEAGYSEGQQARG